MRTPKATPVTLDRVASRAPSTALDAGADDYVTKPFNIRELGARIRSVVHPLPMSILTR
jgi:DNA-binding response OmpR family regulator